METETSNKLSFLDVLVDKTYSPFDFTVYQNTVLNKKCPQLDKKILFVNNFKIGSFFHLKEKLFLDLCSNMGVSEVLHITLSLINR